MCTRSYSFYSFYACNTISMLSSHPYIHLQRNSNPDLSDAFTLARRRTRGSGGWNNSVCYIVISHSADADALFPDTGALDQACHVVECHYGGMVEVR